MDWLRLDDLTLPIIILLSIMLISLIGVFNSDKLSIRINKKYEGDYSLLIKIIGLIINVVCSIIIVLILRG